MSGETTEKKTFMRGVLVLIPAALFTKCVGLFYKIPLLFIVGVEGMAYFLAAYHVYSVLFVLSSTGLPSALSLCVARAVARGENRGLRRILGVALLLFAGIGLGGTLFLMLGAPTVARHLAMPDASAAIFAIAPSLFLAAFIGAVKGYFQGHRKMGSTALSEVLEASGKLGFGLWFALLAKGRGYAAPHIAAYAIFGITVGMALAAAVLLCCLLYHLAVQRAARCRLDGVALPARCSIAGELLRVALPITASGGVMSLVSLLDTALICARLQCAGFAPEIASAIYSSYGNLAIPLYNLVPSLLSPLTLALMPLLGASVGRGELHAARGTLRTAVRICALVAIPATLGLAIFSVPLLELIFMGQSDAIRIAAPLLSVLALSVLPSTLLTLTGAALQALGHVWLPVAAMGAGALLKLLCECVLLGTPGVYIFGAPISTLACTLCVLIIEAVALTHILPFSILDAWDLFRPLLASLPSVVLCAWIFLFCRARFGAQTWQMPVVLAVCVPTTLFLALRLHALSAEDILALPAGDKICRFLQKCKLLTADV